MDLLLLGDGYTAAERRKFEADSRRLLAVLFATSPFKERRSDFNVWGLVPAARESGISRPSTGIHRSNPISSTYDAFGSERYVLAFDNKAFRRHASYAPYDVVEIVVNGRTYGGGGIYGLYSTVAADNAFAPYVFVHEFGHHFAALADEYYTSPVAYLPSATRDEPWEPNVTALLDPNTLKWKDLVKPGTPLPTPWPKEAYEKPSRESQARRAKLRADKRPEAEMEALFAEERRRDDAMFATSERDGRRLRGRPLRGQGLLPARGQLHHVHPRGLLLRGLPARPRAGDRHLFAEVAPAGGEGRHHRPRVQARSATPRTPLWRAQLAQQYMVPAASVP